MRASRSGTEILRGWVPRLLAGGVLGCSLVVLAGWYLRQPVMVQISSAYAPMQYNTALCFALTAAALLMLEAGRFAFARALAISVFLVAALTGLQYFTGRSLGKIDTLFMEPFITVKTSHPGRMAPNTVICFMLIAVGIFIASFKNRKRLLVLPVTLLAALLFVLGIVVLAGYIFGLEAAYGWGAFTRMALPTCVLFILSSGALVFHIWEGEKGFFKALLVLTLGIGFSVTSFILNMKTEQFVMKVHFENEASDRISAVQRELQSVSKAIHTLRAFYDGSRNVDLEEFRDFTEILLKDFPSVVAFDWLPGIRFDERAAYESSAMNKSLQGREIWEVDLQTYESRRAGDRAVYYPVDRTEPFEESSDFLGFDHAADPARVLAMKEALLKNGEAATKPLRLHRASVAGTTGIVLFEPVFEKDANGRPVNHDEKNLTGYLAEILQVSRLLDQAMSYIDPDDDLDIYLEEKTNGGNWETFYFYKARNDTRPREPVSDEILEKNFVPVFTKQLMLGGRQWRVRCTPSSGYLGGRGLVVPWWILGVGLFMTGLLAAYLYLLDSSRDQLFSFNRKLREEIDEREKVQKILESSQRKLEILFDYAPDPVFVCDMKGVFVDLNRKAVELSRYEKNELIGKSFLEVPVLLKKELPRAAFLLGKSILGRPTGPDAFTFLQKGGGSLVVEIRSYPIKIENRPYALGVARDITERRKAELELETERKNLKKVNHELDSFVYTASHDLRAPLRGIASFASFLREDYKDKLDAKGNHYLERIEKGVERMGRLMEDLLTLSRVTRIQNPYEFVELSGVVDVVLQRLDHDIQAAAAEVRIEEKLPRIYCDGIKIAEVFANLIGNGLKFSSRENSGKPLVEVGYQGVRDNEHVFFVRDNGIGIAKDYHDQIFGIFKRLNPAEHYEGTGTGLNIAKRIVEEHKGKIWVESSLGQGACFFFTIPLSLAEGVSHNKAPSKQ